MPVGVTGLKDLQSAWRPFSHRVSPRLALCPYHPCAHFVQGAARIPERNRPRFPDDPGYPVGFSISANFRRYLPLSGPANARWYSCSARVTAFLMGSPSMK